MMALQSSACVSKCVVVLCFVLLSASSFAWPSRRFKELVLHERIIPFDDSLADDDYYGVFDSEEDLLPRDVSSLAVSAASPTPAAGRTSGSHPPSTEAAVTSSETTGSVQTVKNVVEGGSSTRGGAGHGDGRRSGKEGLRSADDDLHEDASDDGGGKDRVTTTTDAGISQDDDVPRFHDPCRFVFCRTGRVCRPTGNGQGKCVCASADHCHGNTRRVCGTDGQFYPSHCELHRAACLLAVHISADRTERSCATNHSISRASVSDGLKSSASEGDLGDDAGETPQMTSSSSSPAAPAAAAASQCTEDEMKTMISALIKVNCEELGTKNFNCTDSSDDRRTSVANVLSHFDRNADTFLELSELTDAEAHTRFSKLSDHCQLPDLLRTVNDKDADGKLSSEEFYSAFGVSLLALDDSLRIYTTSVTIGNSVELKCDVRGVGRIVWKRKGHLLEGTVDKQIRLFDDGSLYIGDLRLYHMGNYTCQDKASNDVIQTHVLLVQTLPRVRVYPSAQIHLTGSTVTLKCHADGVPRPEVTWEKNEWPIHPNDDDNRQRYLFLRNNTILEIKSADFKSDTGAYKCKAKNSAGTSDQVAAVFIENAESARHSSYLKQGELFIVFDDNGYIVYEVGHCHTEHQVARNFRGFHMSAGQQSTLGTLCPDNDTCSWSDAVAVKNKFVYVTQPELNRVVVIETDRLNPVEVIRMESFPVALTYIEPLDEVWITCLLEKNSSVSDGPKRILIIRQASSEHPHFASQFPPVGKEQDEITGVFFPTSDSLQQNFEYGYINLGNKMALHKFHLSSVAVAKEISLVEFGCLPKSVQFIPIGGQVLIGCLAHQSEDKPSFHLLFDYVTDGLLQRLEMNGDSYLSPDGRHLLFIGDHGNTVFVFKVADDGSLWHIFDEYTQLRLDDVAFFPSGSGFDYDAFISSSDQPSILHLDLESGGVSITDGLGEVMTSTSRWPKPRHSRVIVGGGPFAEQLMTSSKKSAFVVDGRRRRIQCEWQDVTNGNVIVALPDYRRA